MPRVAPVKLTGKNGKAFQVIVNAFKKGYVSLLDVGRIPNDGVALAQNMMEDQDGVWRPRYGTKNYGAALTGPITGIYPAVVYNSDGTNTNYLFAMDNGTLKYSISGGAWTSITGKTWSTSATQTIMLQVQGLLFIADGIDDLAYVTLSNMTVTTYTALSPIGTVTVAASTALTSGTTSYYSYYKVTAVNTVGEGAASAEASANINTDRASWPTAQNNNTTYYNTLTWTAVTNATSYNIYYSDITGNEVWIASTSTNSYTDFGYAPQNPFQQAPTTDGTGGPPFTVVRWSDNRMWFTGNAAFPQRVWFSGTGQSLTSLSPSLGGGWFDLNLGSSEKVVDVRHYRGPSGTQMAVIFTSSPNGGGNIWFCQLTTQTAGSVTATVPSLLGQNTVGTSSVRGAVVATNNVFYPSILGFQSIGSAPNIINVIMTTDISAIIRPDVLGINQANASSICGFYYYGRIYWSVPNGSSTNNQIWILDLERQCWTLAWDFGVSQFETYTDSSGQLHFLAIPVGGTNIIEISQDFTNDNGVAFDTDLQSGLVYWDKNHFDWAWVQYVYIEMGRPNGEINFTVSGAKPNQSLQILQSITFNDSYSSSGWGEDQFGSVAWGQSNEAPVVTASSSTKKVLQVNSILNYLQWEITSSDASQQWDLLEIGIIGNIINIGPPANWRE